ncbi:hypothetical protein [Streptomyces venezuelae]|uniref:hypothetical protein n=1 Tax=Streptomyces venezuelae TaxID=54571 RepID=UPI003F541349
MRKGELLGLHWEDLDLDSGTATVHRSLQRTRSQGLTVLKTRTFASERRIVLSTECINSLKMHQEWQWEDRQAAGPGWADTGLVFTASKGRPLAPSTSPAASATRPGSGRTASTISATRRPRCSWNRA